MNDDEFKKTVDFVCTIWRVSPSVIGTGSPESYTAFYAKLKQHYKG